MAVWVHAFFFQSLLFIRTTIRKENMGQRNFRKHFKFHNFSEIFYCDMTRLRNANVSVFYVMSVHKNHFKIQKYGTESV